MFSNASTTSIARFMQGPARPVVGLLGDHPPNTTARIGSVTGVTKDQMDVQVAHRLPGRAAVVDADVVSGRAELHLQWLIRRLEQAEHRCALIGCRVEA
jgi:hypothetical protein